MNNHMIPSLLTFSCLLLSAPAHADVNMLEAGYRTTFIDAEINGLKIQRRYDSRSNFQGLLGFGWCSTFDTQHDAATHQIIECGKPSPTGDAIHKDVTYVQTLKSGLTRIFDADSGELVSLQATGRRPVTVSRTGLTRNRLSRDAALGEGFKTRQGTERSDAAIRLDFDSLGETVVTMVIDPPSGETKTLEFSYSSSRDLLSAKNFWSNTYRFNYDALHNLTRTDFPNRTFEDMQYDPSSDRLTKYTGRDGCIETYEHLLSSEPTVKHQVSTARLSCNGKPKRSAQFNFTFKLKKQRWQLTDMSVKKDSK